MTGQDEIFKRVGVVAIGRNEGERLRACLASLDGYAVAYVDSGSTDGSIALANSFGAQVIALDMSQPFSAARARNAGLHHLWEAFPEMDYVQFVDGDCAIVDGWMETAFRFLENRSDYAVVCGRRRERIPQASIYNRLCDMEWDTPAGDAASCGGDSLMRVASLRQVGGFDPKIIAGEEPELCDRLRRENWKIHRLATEMSLHDAGMTKFSQWWKRSIRTGYGAALCATENGVPAFRKLTRSAWAWGVVLPLAALMLAPLSKGLSLLVLSLYLLPLFRAYRHYRSRQFCSSDASVYAFFCVLAKFPQAQGAFRYCWSKLWSKPSAIIEYKNPLRASGNSR